MQSRHDTCSLIARRYFYPEKAKKGRKLRENHWLPVCAIPSSAKTRRRTVLVVLTYLHTSTITSNIIYSTRRLIYDLNNPKGDIRTLDAKRNLLQRKYATVACLHDCKFLRAFKDKMLIG